MGENKLIIESTTIWNLLQRYTKENDLVADARNLPLKDNIADFVLNLSRKNVPKHCYR